MPRLQMLEVPEAAARLGVTPAVLRQILRRGDLRGVKYGAGTRAKWRVSETELDRYVTRHTIHTNAA